MADRQTTLLTEILEKMIDCQMSSTQALTSLKSTIDETAAYSKEISAHFKNGFRSEIKGHVTSEIDKTLNKQKEILAELESIRKTIESFKSITFWAKVGLGFLTAIGAITAVVLKILTMIP